MGSVSANDNRPQSCAYENSLPEGRHVIELSHISTNTYESLQRDGNDTEGQYAILNRDGDSTKQGAVLRSLVARHGRMIIAVAVVGVVLVLTVIGLIISGVIMYRTLNAKIEELEGERQTQYAEDIVSLRANDSNALDILNDTNTRLILLDNLVQELKKHSDVKSAFSVWYPNPYTAGTLTFSQTIYNYGGDYNVPTGIYTCSKPGVYYFSVSLTKQRASNSTPDRVYCSLYKNSGLMLHIEVDPADDDTDKGSASGSNSALQHLNRGDTVSLGNCYDFPSTTMESWSSFTGFLLYADS